MEQELIVFPFEQIVNAAVQAATDSLTLVFVGAIALLLILAIKESL